jgi:hypothetical protein
MAGYKSGLEEKFQQATKDLGWDFPYEKDRIKYVIPAKGHTYTPDFTVTKNVYIETKGLWTGADRKKACLIRDQHPHIKILYVFYRNQGMSKASKTTYLDFCKKQRLEGCTFQDKETWIAFIRRNLTKTKEEAL